MPDYPTFPTALFAFDDQEVDIERRRLTGGTALSGEEDEIQIDGGGRIFADFANGPLLEREHNLAWRAIKTLADEGAVFIVPFCDKLHQPYGNEHLVPHSDNAEFADDTDYSGGSAIATITAPAALRATVITITGAFSQPLIGGEWFSIDHPAKGWRAYRIASIDGSSISFRPPLREAVQAGDEADFSEPRCLMKQQGQASARMEIGRYGEAAIRFVEAP